ncbi:MAG: FUSC family protein [Burkholderiales bacterium]|nr:FUSC family protein [Burkholderiales bacterium]
MSKGPEISSEQTLSSSSLPPGAMIDSDAKLSKKEKDLNRSNKPTKLALFASAFRFFLAISLCLGFSLIFNAPREGGYACLACFMMLLADTNNSLWARIGGTLIVLLVVAVAAVIGFLSKQIPDGKWLVVIIACFGTSLLTYAENFWWLVFKYFLVFLMTFLYDYSPNLQALEGYILGYCIAVIVITVDHFMWKINRLGTRPMVEIKRFIGGVRNPKSFAIISTFVVIFGLWSALEMRVRDPAWVGITIVYLMNTKISTGIEKSVERIVGNALGYLIVVLIFAIPDITNLWILGPFILLVGTPIPVFFTENYLLSQTCISAYILLVIEWLTSSYGGEGSLLGWRLVDTIWGSTCVMGGFIVMAFVSYINKKIDERRYKKAEKEAEALELLENQFIQ